MDLHKVTRLVEQTAVGGRARLGKKGVMLTQLARGGGEGGEGFYIARSGRRADLLVFLGEGGRAELGGR